MLLLKLNQPEPMRQDRQHTVLGVSAPLDLVHPRATSTPHNLPHPDTSRCLYSIRLSMLQDNCIAA